MSTNPAAGQPSADAIMARVLEVKGNLAELTEEERHEYYMAVVKSVGLNSLTRPFAFITLEGKLVLYALKDCTEQLRKIHKVSTKILGKELIDDIYTVHVHAIDKEHREDEDIGAVHMKYPEFFLDPTDQQLKKHPKAGKPLVGVDRANTIMKAVTKAKRRVTLSICGLGMLDESEIADALAAEKLRSPPEPKDAVRAPAPGERKALPPKVGEQRAAQGPRDKPEDEPERTDADEIFDKYKRALAKPKDTRALQKAHNKFNQELGEVEDDDLIEKCLQHYKERQRQLMGEDE